MTLARPQTPPMGWNSWDSYGTTITEDELLRNAEFMATRMLPYGWDTVVIDADWADPTPRSHGYTDAARLTIDGHGRLQPDPVRFPSSADGSGFTRIAGQIHDMGLKFGLHVMRGIPRVAVRPDVTVFGTEVPTTVIADPENRCEWNPHYDGLDLSHPASRAYYASCVTMYAEWGVDYIKADDMLWPYQSADIEAYAQAVADVPRSLVLSLSPGRDLSQSHLAHLRDHTSMWRISDDVWDKWEDIEPNFARLARWAPHARPGAWPDADMLPLGRIGLRAERGEPRHDLLTPAQRTSLLSLWILARSPLMVGGDLPTSRPETIDLLCRADVLQILRDSRDNRELLNERDVIVWGAESDDYQWAGVFNMQDAARDIVLDSTTIGFGSAPGPVRELWTGTSVITEAISVQSDAARSVAPGSTAVRLRLEPHGAALLRRERRS